MPEIEAKYIYIARMPINIEYYQDTIMGKCE